MERRPNCPTCPQRLCLRHCASCRPIHEVSSLCIVLRFAWTPRQTNFLWGITSTSHATDHPKNIAGGRGVVFGMLVERTAGSVRARTGLPHATAGVCWRAASEEPRRSRAAVLQLRKLRGSLPREGPVVRRLLRHLPLAPGSASGSKGVRYHACRRNHGGAHASGSFRRCACDCETYRRA